MILISIRIARRADLLQAYYAVERVSVVIPRTTMAQSTGKV